MNFDFIIEGNVFTNGSFHHCCIGIEDGKIVSIKKILTGAKKKTFSKQTILPAGIDIHVHFRDPGYPSKETFTTGSTAAAYGGVSCVFDMPNTTPQTISTQSVLSKIRNAAHTSLVDFGIYGGISDDTLPTINKLYPLVPGFKVFLGSSTNSLHFSTQHLPDLFKQLQGASKPLLFHAEDADCLQQHKREEHNLIDHHLARPYTCEQKAVETILSHAPFPCPVHVCHVSSTNALHLLQHLSSSLSFGVTPHHCLLHLHHKNLENHPSYGKVNPPLRQEEHQTKLLHAVTKGNIPIIESDHAPHAQTEKHQSFHEAPCGISGVETMYPLFLSLAAQQKIPIQIVINAICTRPASLFGLSKGLIKEGYDADFIAVDMKQPKIISSDALHSKASFSPFEGFSAIFPNDLFIRGHHVIEDSELIGKPGLGAHIIEDL